MMTARTGATAVGLTVLQVPDTEKMTQFYRLFFAAEPQGGAAPEVTVLRFPSGGHLAFAATPDPTRGSSVRISLTVPDIGTREQILAHLAAEGHTASDGAVLDPAGNTVDILVRTTELPAGRARVIAGTTHRFSAAARCRSLLDPTPEPSAERPKPPWEQFVDWFQRTGLQVTGSVLDVDKLIP
ncbi:VOC family protein [Corynebacterium hylobatis]|uniref:VOC family protein n=1 Tax=Corynebacterium hylobatis TaxID=1859290 RepID=A0A3S0BH03_9CORY|nr:VOC family protein [Corynebacterium hylobatis]RSZ62359.1 VOC family protein [Corynebacterium hylobatis]